MTENVKAKVWCRDCGEEMKQAPYNQLWFFCRKCELEATVQYNKMHKMTTWPDFGKAIPIGTKKPLSEMSDEEKKDINNYVFVDREQAGYWENIKIRKTKLGLSYLSKG